MSLTHAPWRCRTSTPSPTTGKAQVGGGGGGEPATPSIPYSSPPSRPSFRMRQVNIVGTSPPSQPSRKIQTLQAPPDMAPANVTLRTASETSLWLRWMVRLSQGQWDRTFIGLSPPCVNMLTSKVFTFDLGLGMQLFRLVFTFIIIIIISIIIIIISSLLTCKVPNG